MDVLENVQRKHQKENQDEFDLAFKAAVDSSIRYHRIQYDRLSVAQGFSELPNVDSLSLLSLGSPFSESELVLRRTFNTAQSQATDESSMSMPFVDEQILLIRYLFTLLRAFSHLEDKLRQLRLDSMLLDMFVRPEENFDASDSDADETSILLRKRLRRNLGQAVKQRNFPDGMTNLSRNVRKLQIGIKVMLRHETSRTLSRYLGSMQFLRSLDFSWDIWKQRDLHGLDTGFELALQASFYANTWPHLKDLRLCRVPTNTALL